MQRPIRATDHRHLSPRRKEATPWPPTRTPLLRTLSAPVTSDGVHKQITDQRLAEIARDHDDDPRALAEAIVAEPQADDDGYRDDATVVVLLRAPAAA